jgi:hypothetical protein
METRFTAASDEGVPKARNPNMKIKTEKHARKALCNFIGTLLLSRVR